jgi:hypothetical protein
MDHKKDPCDQCSLVPTSYTYAWATDATWRGCKRLVMKLKDGSVYGAIFDFRK